MARIVVIYGRFHIHKMKWADQKPCWNHFLQEFKLDKNTVTQIVNRKACQTSYILNKFCTAFNINWYSFIYLLIYLSLIWRPLTPWVPIGYSKCMVVCESVCMSTYEFAMYVYISVISYLFTSTCQNKEKKT